MALFMIDTVGECDLLEKDALDDSFEPLTTQYGPGDSENEDEEDSSQQVSSTTDDNEEDELYEDCDFEGRFRYLEGHMK